MEVWPVLRGGEMEWGSDLWELVLIGRFWWVIISSPSCFVKYRFVLLDTPVSGSWQYPGTQSGGLGAVSETR